MAELGDDQIRMGAFAFLQTETDGGRLPVRWKRLTTGYRVRGEAVQLIGQRGIWKPRQLELPISITTAPPTPGRPAPYDDTFDDDGILTYRYQGDSAANPDNRRLRQAMLEGKGLIYFHGISKGVYQATWPVYVVQDRPAELAYSVIVSDPQLFRPDLDPSAVDVAERRYSARLARQRLHQADFRHRVLSAYREQCGFCRLKHPELLDAAHIRADAAGGSPATSNGLSLCKIHHSAFDHHIVGIRPDHVLEVRPDILDEVDGPMLRHGLQAMHGEKLILPRSMSDRPDPELVEERYEQFLAR